MSSYAKVGCHNPAVFEAGTKRLVAHLGELKPAFVAELASSLAMAGHLDQAFMRRLGAIIKRRFHDYSPSMLCNALWAFSASRTFHADLFNLSCSKLANLVARGQLPYQDVAQVSLNVCIMQNRRCKVMLLLPMRRSDIASACSYPGKRCSGRTAEWLRPGAVHVVL